MITDVTSKLNVGMSISFSAKFIFKSVKPFVRKADSIFNGLALPHIWVRRIIVTQSILNIFIVLAYTESVVEHLNELNFSVSLHHWELLSFSVECIHKLVEHICSSSLNIRIFIGQESSSCLIEQLEGHIEWLNLFKDCDISATSLIVLIVEIDNPLLLNEV